MIHRARGDFAMRVSSMAGSAICMIVLSGHGIRIDTFEVMRALRRVRELPVEVDRVASA